MVKRRRSNALVFAVVGAALVGGVEGHVLFDVECVELLQDVVPLVHLAVERKLDLLRDRPAHLGVPEGLEEEERVLQRDRVEGVGHGRHARKVVVERVRRERQEAALGDDAHDGHDVQQDGPRPDGLPALVRRPLCAVEEAFGVSAEVVDARHEDQHREERHRGPEQHQVPYLRHLFGVLIVDAPIHLQLALQLRFAHRLLRQLCHLPVVQLCTRRADAAQLGQERLDDKVVD
mmetsp:Transcript_34447/g.81596  ORF Transcript_34447/g.81596 Transcript_34447/m.81596 type:complete len:233 (+) Transcript_34447:385-1083(+)